MQKGFLNVLIVYLIIIIVIVVIIKTAKHDRQFFRRMFVFLHPNPFGKKVSFEEFDREGRIDGKVIVAVSLYGNVSKYIPRLLELSERIKTFFPEGQLRVYTDKSIDETLRSSLLQSGAEVVRMTTDSVNHEGTLWRFLAAEDDIPFISTDADDNDLFYPERIKSLRKWLNSPKSYYIQRHPFSILLPMTAGRWGGKKKIEGIRDKLSTYTDDWFGIDEAFLNKDVYPQIKNDIYYSPPDKREFLVWGGITLFIFLIIFSLYNIYRI